MSSPAKLTYFVACRRADVRRLVNSAVGIQREQEHILDPQRLNKLRTVISQKSSAATAMASPAVTAMTSPAKLTYLPGRGRAEGIRLTLSAVGIQWEEEHISSPDKFDELKKEDYVLFKQLPVLEIDGLKITQTFSIVRYLAMTHGLMGKSPEDSVQIDMLTEGARDMSSLGFNAKIFTPKDKQEGMISAAMKTSRKRYLPVYEKVLQENGSGYLVGNSVSMADMVFLEVLLWMYEYEPILADEYPNIKKFHDTLTSLPQLKAYLEGPQRFPQPDRRFFDAVTAAFKISKKTINRVIG